MTPEEKKSQAGSTFLGACIGFTIGAILLWQLLFGGGHLSNQSLAVVVVCAAIFAILGAIVGAAVG
jgi:hypothetical protein